MATAYKYAIVTALLVALVWVFALVMSVAALYLDQQSLAIEAAESGQADLDLGGLQQPAAPCLIHIKRVVEKANGTVTFQFCVDQTNDGVEDGCYFKNFTKEELKKGIEENGSINGLLQKASGLTEQCKIVWDKKAADAFAGCNYLIEEPAPEDPPTEPPAEPPTSKPPLCVAIDGKVFIDPKLTGEDKKKAEEIAAILGGAAVAEKEKEQCTPKQAAILDKFIQLATNQVGSNVYWITSFEKYFVAKGISIDPAKYEQTYSALTIVRDKYYFRLLVMYKRFNNDITETLLPRLKDMRSGKLVCNDINIENHARPFRNNLKKLIGLWEDVIKNVPMTPESQQKIRSVQNDYKEGIIFIENLVPTIGKTDFGPPSPAGVQKIGTLYISSDDHKPQFCPPCQTLKGLMGNLKDKNGNSWKDYVNIVNDYPPTGGGIPELILNNNQSVSGASGIANKIKEAVNK